MPSPHEGTSYNPPVAAHQSLLRLALEKEEERVKEAEELKKTKEKIEKARRAADEVEVVGVPSGMTVQEVVEESEDDEDSEGEEGAPAKRMPERKTKKERRKAEKRRAEVCFIRSTLSLNLSCMWPRSRSLMLILYTLQLRNAPSPKNSLQNASSHPSPPRSPSANPSTDPPSRAPNCGSRPNLPCKKNSNKASQARGSEDTLCRRATWTCSSRRI